MEKLKIITCPICGDQFTESLYLSQAFKDQPEVKFLANLVTHYRHSHIVTWNKCWGRNGDKYRSTWFTDYDTEKQKFNERAKRQIIRKAKLKLKELGISPVHFALLKGTEKKTMDLAMKYLGVL
jgi:hypothetical protein